MQTPTSNNAATPTLRPPELEQAIRREREDEDKLCQIFGDACTLQQMFDLEDRWANLTVHQRKHILRRASPKLYGSGREVFFSNESLGNLHISNNKKPGVPLGIKQCQEIVRILREEDLNVYH